MHPWITARLPERSTWYGLGVVIAGAASHFAPTEWGAFLAGVQFVLGAGAALTPERKS
jgi:hypothetical protein